MLSKVVFRAQSNFTVCAHKIILMSSHAVSRPGAVAMAVWLLFLNREHSLGMIQVLKTDLLSEKMKKEITEMRVPV
jgi:hypothetical protein